jgi:hypothetical protein
MYLQINCNVVRVGELIVVIIVVTGMLVVVAVVAVY